MDLDELRQRLIPFCREHLGDPTAEVTSVEPTSGHAGFSYFFDVATRGETRRYFLRLPPPNVKLEGTADVLRQVAALAALEGTAVPHATVLWSGDDPRWFGLPYFVTPRLEGDVLRLEPGDWGSSLSPAGRAELARQAMAALAGSHRADPARAPYLGRPLDMTDDVTRWDRFYERAAEPERLRDAPLVRQALLDRIPAGARIGIFHGDFQWANMLFSPDGRLLAVIDWELVGIGATLNDLGWILTFNDPAGWPAGSGATRGLMGTPDELQAMYTEAYGADPGDVAWFRALAAYKFAIITGFNLMLHRRGKRHDPHCEIIAPCAETLIARARTLLGA